MNTLLKTTVAFGFLFTLGANHDVEARSSFSLYLGGPSYVTPYYAPQPYYVPHYYVAPQPYYVAPQRYYRYEYAPVYREYYYY